MMKDKTIVLGVTGSIAAYKAADLASKLVQLEANVRVAMTGSAAEFVSPLTFRSLTNNAVATGMFEPLSDYNIEHVALAEAADVVVIAPATANMIANMAVGIADDIVSCTVLATEAPVIVAPAMHGGMYQNPVTQENIARLKARGFIFVDPEYGRLASGGAGMGRMADVEKIIDAIRKALSVG